jgi:hypothetical protein
MRERTVEQHLVHGLAKIGVACEKFIPDHRRGMPDRIVLLPGGRVVWVELKTDGGSLSAIQLVRHHELTKAGQIVKVVWSIEEADNLIEEIKSGYLS